MPRINLGSIVEKVSTHQIGSGQPGSALQAIHTVGEPDNSIELRFEQGDTECLVTCDDGSMQTRLWLKADDLKDLLEAVQKAVQAIR